jgi:hypothetical protein
MISFLIIAVIILALLQLVALYLVNKQRLKYDKWFNFPDPKDIMSMTKDEVIGILKEQDRYSPRWLEDLLEILYKKEVITTVDLPYIVRIQLEERRCLRKRLEQLNIYAKETAEAAAEERQKITLKKETTDGSDPS